MSNQDWNIINIGKNKINQNKDIVEKRKDICEKQELQKIENDNENFEIKKIPSNLTKEIITARNLSKMNQKEISTKLNIQHNIYIELENGKAIYNNKTKELIQKIQKLLKVKFLNK